MPPTLDDAWAKVEWAHGKLLRLYELLGPFHGSKPYLLRDEINPERTHRILTAEHPMPVPDDVPLVLGDLIHALHSTLDYVVCSLVEKSGRTLATAHAFPIFPTRPLYDAKAPKMLRYVPYEAIKLIESLQPYHEAERAEAHGLSPKEAAASAERMPLMHLYRLSIEEKHRALLLSTAVFTSIGTYVPHDRTDNEGSGIDFGFSESYDRAVARFRLDPDNPDEAFDPHFASKVTLVKEGPRGQSIEKIARMLYGEVAHQVLPKVWRLDLLPLSRPRELPIF